MITSTNYKVSIVMYGLLATTIMSAMIQDEHKDEPTYTLPELPAHKTSISTSTPQECKKISTKRAKWLHGNQKICVVIPEQCRHIRNSILKHQLIELYEKDRALLSEAIVTHNEPAINRIQQQISRRTTEVDQDLSILRNPFIRYRKHNPKINKRDTMIRDILQRNIQHHHLLLKRHADKEAAIIESGMRESQLHELLKKFKSEEEITKQLALLKSPLRENRKNLPDDRGSLQNLLAPKDFAVSEPSDLQHISLDGSAPQYIFSASSSVHLSSEDATPKEDCMPQ